MNNYLLTEKSEVCFINSGKGEQVGASWQERGNEVKFTSHWQGLLWWKCVNNTCASKVSGIACTQGIHTEHRSQSTFQGIFSHNNFNRYFQQLQKTS